MKQLTLGSFFDGIGGWLIAATKNGVKPIWASEIDEFPASVTAHHFPEVKQLGDITKLTVDDLEPVDIVCAGSPCQDLSVANGKREGLLGERSGLFRTAIDLVHGLRHRTNGEYPRFFVWENVPGAFSSNHGEDFRAVLEEIGQSSIPMPASGKWATAGMVEFPSCVVEWRCLDAQYWSVPQRRVRIFLIADFAKAKRGGRTLLFEPEGLLGYPSESRSTKQETTRETRAGSERASRSLLSNAYIDNPLTTEDGRSV